MENSTQNKGANKVTKNSKIEFKGVQGWDDTTLWIEKTWKHGARGAYKTLWEITDGDIANATQKFESLWQAIEQMQRYADQGGRVVAS